MKTKSKENRQGKIRLLIIFLFVLSVFPSCSDENGDPKSVIEVIIPTGTLGS